MRDTAKILHNCLNDLESTQESLYRLYDDIKGNVGKDKALVSSVEKALVSIRGAIWAVKSAIDREEENAHIGDGLLGESG